MAVFGMCLSLLHPGFVAKAAHSIVLIHPLTPRTRLGHFPLIRIYSNSLPLCFVFIEQKHMTGPSTGSGYIPAGAMSPKSQQEMAEKLKSLKRRFDDLEEVCFVLSLFMIIGDVKGTW